MNPEAALVMMLAEPGSTETATGSGAAIVIAAEDDRVVSVTEVAVRVTTTFTGIVLDGVKVVGAPAAVVVGATEPQAGEHGAPACMSDQVTPALLPSY